MSKKDRTIFAPQIPVWRMRDIITELGGVGPLTEKLIAKGFFPPGPDTVQGWVTRNSVPGPWSPAVLALALEEGIIKSPKALLKHFRMTETESPAP
jgi:hypothetical protein